MKLWLDDCRPAPEGWIHTRTAWEAIDRLRSGQVDEMSLDYDLGSSGEGTGLDVVQWLVLAREGGREECIPSKIAVHSRHAAGARKMAEVLQSIGITLEPAVSFLTR